MPNLPLIRTTNPGITHTLTGTTQSDALTVPAGALGCVIWFEDGSGTTISGRVGIDQADTQVTIDDDNMGWHPPQAVEYTFLGYNQSGETYRYRDNYLHVGCATAGAVVRGSWLFAVDTGS